MSRISQARRADSFWPGVTAGNPRCIAPIQKSPDGATEGCPLHDPQIALHLPSLSATPSGFYCFIAAIPGVPCGHPRPNSIGPSGLRACRQCRVDDGPGRFGPQLAMERLLEAATYCLIGRPQFMSQCARQSLGKEVHHEELNLALEPSG